MLNFISIKWDRFLIEGEADHFPWLKDIKSIDPEELRDWMANSDRFIPVGRGSFRAVYVPREDEDYVVKIVHDLDRDKLQMNKDDFNTAKRYPFIFPKAYAHADDFSWIVMEKASPLVDTDEMQKVLDQSFPTEQEALVGALTELGKDGGWWAQWNPADPFHIMKMIMGSFRFDRDINEVVDPTLVTARHGRGTNKEAVTARDLQDILTPVAGRAYQELSKAMHEFEIDKYEIGIGNIGHDEDYNFKIIDSSVFSSDPEEGGW
jgi:hypothetical protein